MALGIRSWLAHLLKNLSLIALSLLTLPLDTLILFFNLVARHFVQDEVAKRRSLIRGTYTPYFAPKTILVTGVGMSKGLNLARQFYAAGHNVIGADIEPNGALNPGRVSKSIKKFYRLTAPSEEKGATPYVQSLLDIVTHEDVHLWVSCSGVASAVEDGEAKEAIERLSPCKCVQFDVETTQKLHEKHMFIEHTAAIGLNVPETHTITSQYEALNLLKVAGGKQFILKSLVLDDASRGDMTLLPCSTLAETEKHLHSLRISPQTPWILQQYIRGAEYCTHALVTNSIVRVFVACPSSDLLMHYEALPHESPLTQAMLEFTQKFAERQGEQFTGHLSFDFLVAEDEMEELKKLGRAHGAKLNLWPIECNPRAHTAVVLFEREPKMIGAYVNLLKGPKDRPITWELQEPKEAHGSSFVIGDSASPIIWPNHPQKYYWSGHDLVTLAIMPLVSFLISFVSGKRCSASPVYDNFHVFINHVLLWKDGTFEFWDPWPWWWLYHVYWPMRFIYYALSGKRWSRINVSTGKVFEG